MKTTIKTALFAITSLFAYPAFADDWGTKVTQSLWVIIPYSLLALIALGIRSKPAKKIFNKVNNAISAIKKIVNEIIKTLLIMAGSVALSFFSFLYEIFVCQILFNWFLVNPLNLQRYLSFWEIGGILMTLHTIRNIISNPKELHDYISTQSVIQNIGIWLAIPEEKQDDATEQLTEFSKNTQSKWWKRSLYRNTYTTFYLILGWVIHSLQ